MMATQAAAPAQRIPFIALLSSYGAVHFSILLAMMAIPWFVLETTGSAARTGLATAMQGVPMVIAGVFGGVIVDRFGFRRTAILSDIFSGIAFGMIPVLHFTTGITFWQLLVFIFLGSLFDTPGFTARLSMMPDIAQRAGVRLERANSISQTLSQSSILLAPAVAGVTISMIGAASVLWITMSMFFVSVLAISILIPRPDGLELSTAQPRGRYMGELMRGVSFLINGKLIMALLISVTLIQFLRANLMVIMPVYAHDFYGSAADFGFMFAALGAGGLVSAIAFAVWGHRWPRRPIILAGVASLSIAFWLLAMTPPYWVILSGLFVAGVLNGPVIPLIFTLMQERIPRDLRGRVFGLYDASIFGAMVPGRLMAGFMIEWTSIVQTLVIVGSGYMIAIVAMLFNPHLHGIPASPRESSDDSRPTEPPQSSDVAGETSP